MRMLLGAVVVAVVGCGGGGTSPSPAPSSTFAGTYGTAVTLLTSTCGSIAVQNNPTVVTFDAGTRGATFTHAGITYTGTVAADSSFSTPARPVDVGDGFTYAIAIAGKFRVNGFDATATIDQFRSGVACRFTVRWVGTRS